MITARCGIFMLKKHISYVLAMFFNFTPKNKTTMQAQNPYGCCIFIGGDEGDRTPDLLNAIQALSQLSYAPKALQTILYGKKVSLSI